MRGLRGLRVLRGPGGPKSHYIYRCRAGRHFYGTEIKMRFGLLPILKKNWCPIMSNF